MPLKYQSGTEIKKSDAVLFHGEPGEIEFIADPLVNDPETDWYVEEYGGGVMILEPKKFGRAFLSQPEDSDDLVFVSRSADSSSAAKS